MVILGIDPGYAIVGFGVVEYNAGKFRTLNYGAIETAAGTKFENRLKKVYDGVTQIIEYYKPQALAIEQLFFTTNQKTVIMVAEARGTILLSAVNNAVPIFEYTPLQVKQSVVGYGRADKHQVMELTRNILHLKEIPRPDDAADALAIAVCHAHASGSRIGAANNYNKAVEKALLKEKLQNLKYRKQ